MWPPHALIVFNEIAWLLTFGWIPSRVITPIFTQVYASLTIATIEAGAPTFKQTTADVLTSYVQYTCGFDEKPSNLSSTGRIEYNGECFSSPEHLLFGAGHSTGYTVKKFTIASELVPYESPEQQPWLARVLKIDFFQSIVPVVLLLCILWLMVRKMAKQRKQYEAALTGAGHDMIRYANSLCNTFFEQEARMSEMEGLHAEQQKTIADTTLAFETPNTISESQKVLLVEKNSQLAIFEDKINKLESLLAEKNNAVDAATRVAVSEKDAELVERANKERALLTEQMQVLRTEKEEVECSLRQAKKDIETYKEVSQREIQDTQQKLEAVNAELAAVKSQLAGAKGDINTAELGKAKLLAELRTAQEHSKTALSDCNAMKAAKTAAEAKQAEAESCLRAAKNEIEVLDDKSLKNKHAAEQQIGVINAKLPAANAQLKETREELSSVKAAHEVTKKQAEQTQVVAQKEKQNTERRLEDAGQKLEAVNAELATTKGQLAKAYSGLKAAADADEGQRLLQKALDESHKELSSEKAVHEETKEGLEQLQLAMKKTSADHANTCNNLRAAYDVVDKDNKALQAEMKAREAEMEKEKALNLQYVKLLNEAVAEAEARKSNCTTQPVVTIASATPASKAAQSSTNAKLSAVATTIVVPVTAAQCNGNGQEESESAAGQRKRERIAARQRKRQTPGPEARRQLRLAKENIHNTVDQALRACTFASEIHNCPDKHGYSMLAKADCEKAFRVAIEKENIAKRYNVSLDELDLEKYATKDERGERDSISSGQSDLATRPILLNPKATAYAPVSDVLPTLHSLSSDSTRPVADVQAQKVATPASPPVIQVAAHTPAAAVAPASAAKQPQTQSTVPVPVQSSGLAASRYAPNAPAAAAAQPQIQPAAPAQSSGLTDSRYATNTATTLAPVSAARQPQTQSPVPVPTPAPAPAQSSGLAASRYATNTSAAAGAPNRSLAASRYAQGPDSTPAPPTGPRSNVPSYRGRGRGRGSFQARPHARGNAHSAVQVQFATETSNQGDSGCILGGMNNPSYVRNAGKGGLQGGKSRWAD